MHEKHFKQWVITYLVISPVWAVNLDYVLIVTWTYLNFPNSVIWVTPICHIWLGSSPQRFTPKWSTGKYCGHLLYCLTIWSAASLVNLNCFLFFKYLFIYYVYNILSVCTPAGQKRAPDLIPDGCEPPCGCWELNSGPLEEQAMLLTTEPSLQPSYFSLKFLSGWSVHWIERSVEISYY